MTSARTIRKNHKTRTFVSKRYVWPDGVWGPWRNGMAYGDVRSHQKRRHAPVGVGTRALNTLPCDALHLDRKEQKKEIAAQHSANKRWLRELAKLKSDRAKTSFGPHTIVDSLPADRTAGNAYCAQLIGKELK